MKKICRLLLCICMLSSCNTEKKQIEFALMEAGNNRGEIETVLEYYKNNDSNPLKFKAAQYLIRYMPYHYSYGEEIKDYYRAVDSVIQLSADKLVQERCIKDLTTLYENRYKLQRDIKVITADFLIQSIDQAFDQWQNGKWAKHLNFDEFCEYLLPYKCFEGQPLDNWRNMYYDICKGDIDKAYLCDDYNQSSFFAAMEVNQQMKNATPQSFGLLTTLPIYDPGVIMRLPFASCSAYCMGSVQLMRSKGIPVAYDFTPHWSNRQNGHSWNTASTSRFGNLEFAPHETDPGSVHYPFLKMPKVFRAVYKPNDEYLKISKAKYIPRRLRDMFIKDVSSDYMPTMDVKIPLSVPLNGKHPFIAVYDCNEWTPVYWGKVGGKSVTFERMGLNTMYIALAYDLSDKYTPISHPFLVSTSKQIEFIELDTTSYRTIRLARKFPQGDNIFSINKLTSGGIFEVADNKEFRNSRKITELPEWNLTNGSVLVNDIERSRYWRFKSSDTSRCDMAEVYFYDVRDSIMRADIIDCGKVLSDNPEWEATNIADGNQLTNFSVKGDEYWVGFDFGKPVNVSKISYIRRCDGNSIEPGLEYSLYFWNNSSWQLIGTKKVNNVFVEFDNVPVKTLLAIKCSQGQEQRIFICDENGKISWY